MSYLLQWRINAFTLVRCKDITPQRIFIVFMRSIVRNECHEMIEEMLEKVIAQTQSFCISRQYFHDINICIMNKNGIPRSILKFSFKTYKSWNHLVTMFLILRHEISLSNKTKSCRKLLNINSAVFQLWKYGTAKVQFVTLILKSNYFCCIMMFENLTQHNKIR